MNNISKSKQKDVFEDDEIFEDSSFLAKFDNTSFNQTNTSAKLSESNINDSLNKCDLNVSALCCDEEISGYDKLTGKTWIYPTNYPVRDYQFNIIKAAILKNTLVSLPTGLGKTFIAAVIMYNFYRWYPLGKIVFTAPTRPLVAQQIEACYDIIAIPPNDTIEMTGHMQVNTRKAHWQTKRVFFATPQVIYNDIKSGICPSEKIRCLVIDEAHRARGNYAYCQIVGSLDDLGHKTYRLLALSATPGSKVEDVINVVKSLHIAHLELRTENCIDVAPYSHTRKINTVIIKLGSELSQLRQHYVEILDGYARRLKQLNILPHNLGNLSKGRIVMLYKEFQTKDRGARHAQHNYIMKDFTLLIALFHGLELLVKHGTRVFLNFFDEHPEKSWIQSDDNLTALLERLRDDLGINPLSLDRSILPDGTIPDMPQDLCFGHPKFDKLKDIMTEHFVQAKRKGEDTRAIVFCEYRESVNLVHCLLLQCRPLITPQMFVGQGASGKDGKTVISQKQQLRVMRNFREGLCNVLVATCVAEEGLDVGSVDLIICFDISTRSPIRLVQRCGRTGRERGGQVHILVTEGREHQTLLDCMRQKDGLNKKILQSKDVETNLYKLNPRMVPHGFTPQCQKMFITVTKKNDPKEKNKEGIDKSKKLQGQKDLRTMLLGRASSSNSGSLMKETNENHNIITEDEFKDTFPDGMPFRATFVGSREYWAMSKDKIMKINSTQEHGQLNLSTWLEWQRTLHKTVNIEHSKDSEILTELLRYSDAKRFDMPASTQNPVFNSQDFATQDIAIPHTSPVKPKPKSRLKQPVITKSPAKKDGDIRALFSTATKSTKSYTKLINDLGVPNDGSIPTSLINLLVDLSLDNTNSVKKCFICLNVCDCSLIQNLKSMKKHPPVLLSVIGQPKFPDLDLIDEIDADCILKCMKNNSIDHTMKNSTIVDNKNCSTNFDLEFDFDIPDDMSPLEDEVPKEEKIDESIDKNFDIGDIEDIFADSSPEEAIEKQVVKIPDDNPKEEKETLGFFGLDSIEDIFADYDESIECVPKTAENKNEVQINNDDKLKDTVLPLSPSILSGKVRDIPTSPILCSQVRKFKLSTKKVQPQSSTPHNVQRSLFQETKNNDEIIIIPDENEKESNAKISDYQKSITNRNSSVDTSNKSMFTITQLVEMINKTENSQSILKSNITKETNNTANTKYDDERSTSPILLTQADRMKSSVNTSNIFNAPLKKSTSIVILDSDSDSNDDTQEYDVGTATKVDLNESVSKNVTPVNSKRKYETEDTISASPYFNKRQKLDIDSKKPLTIQEKVLAALSTNKNKNNFSNNTTLNFTVSQPNFVSQKENIIPKCLNNSCENENDIDEKSIGSNNLDMLKMFKRDSKVNILRNKFDSIFKKSPKKAETSKRKLDFNESDDDFVDDEKSYRSPKTINNYHPSKSTTNHKVRKKKKANSFLDLEADLSGSEGQHSGDELSDDSIGSIIDFICDDDNEINHDDIQAHYLRSIKSPLNNGGFKIPMLPNKYVKEDVLSQFVEEDAYEMDSFCVDSHIGLTQANDVSELELAEIALEEERRNKKRRNISNPPQEDGESPLIRKKKKVKRRQIHSDSDDSS